MSIRTILNSGQRNASDIITNNIGFVLIAAALVTLPFWFGAVGGYLSLATTMLVWILFAIGYDIELGYTGQLSLAHTVMFGIGGYGTGLLMVHITDSAFLAIALSLILTAIVATIIGWLCHRTSGLFFALATLAFTMMFYFAATQIRAVGGHDGLSGIPPIVNDPLLEYYTVLAIIIVGALIAYHLVSTPYGRALIGIRENEQRLQHLGYNVTQYKISAFVVSGLFAGLAGSLLAGTSGFIGPEVFFWMTSFQIVIYTVIGGMGTITGPILGAAVFVALESIVGARIAHWEPLLGMMFILVIVFFPGGLYMIASKIGGELK